MTGSDTGEKVEGHDGFKITKKKKAQEWAQAEKQKQETAQIKRQEEV